MNLQNVKNKTEVNEAISHNPKQTYKKNKQSLSHKEVRIISNIEVVQLKIICLESFSMCYDILILIV